MILETGHLTEALVTNVAAEGLITRVNTHVLPQDILRFERLFADLAHILPPGLGDQAWRLDGLRGRHRRVTWGDTIFAIGQLVFEQRVTQRQLLVAKLVRETAYFIDQINAQIIVQIRIDLRHFGVK